jgi:hypothetical protein
MKMKSNKGTIHVNLMIVPTSFINIFVFFLARPPFCD